MKRMIALVLALSAAGGAFAQEAAPRTVVQGTRYEVSSDGDEEAAKLLAREMDRRFEVYSALFRFDPDALEGKLRVRAFSDKAAMDAYLAAALGQSREGATYLHYSAKERRELVALENGTPGDRVFAHQAFVQYLRAFVPNAPAWLREGFAVVFETLAYDPRKDSFEFEENLAWLETVKAWGKNAPTLEEILTAAEAPTLPAERFTPAAWAAASFLLNAQDEGYRRFLYESFMLLAEEASAAENARSMLSRGAAWMDPERAQSDFAAYLQSRKTFAELIDEGRAKYAAKDPAAAQEAFLAAADLKPTHYAPHYYLGLLAYERKDYALAENSYRSALQYGADEALVSFALGVNAAADGRSADARNFLTKAKTIAPARYGARADELLAKLK